jgi:hypothetical protein
MEYLVLLYDNEATAAQPGTPEWDADMAGYNAFGELAGPSIRGGEALWDTSTARTLRHTGDEVQVTNGPFAETTEALGGYYVLDAPSLDDAIELARNIPTATTGAIEVRPMVMHLPAPETDAIPGAETDATSGADSGGEQPPAAGDTARYLATIHGPAKEEPDPGTPEWEASLGDHAKFAEDAGTALVGGGAVHPAATATTIRVREGELLVTDGPFAEGTEMTGGYYVVKGTADEAAALAGRIPLNPSGWIELRPIMELDG